MVVSPPLPPPPVRRSKRWALAIGLLATAVLVGSVIVAGTQGHSSATPATTSPGTSAGTSSLPAELGGAPRITSGPAWQRIQSEAPALPVPGASYDLAMYGDPNRPSSLLMVIHGLGDAVNALPSNIFFQTVGNGLASGMARVGMAGSSADFAGSVQSSAGGADHDCIPLRDGDTAKGVICLFRTSGDLGMVVLFDESDPHAAIEISKEAAAAVT